MRKKVLVALIVPFLVLAAGGALFYADHALSREDRLAATARTDAMILVRDQLLRYESDRGALPASLEKLVGEYVHAAQLEDEQGPVYVFDPAARTLSQARPSIIHGLFSREWPPVVMELPEPGPEVLAARQARLNAVRDALLLYRKRHHSLPRTLIELVPKYLYADQLFHDGTALYIYDPLARTLAEAPDSLLLPPAGEGSEYLSVSFPPNGDDVVTEHEPADDRLFGENGIAIVPKSPELPEPPEGALVFEAEHFSEMNYGWEVRREAAASGGAYLHSWEGIGNGPAQINHGVYNFYDSQPKNEYTALRYHFHVSEDGNYHAYGLMWTTDTHCSNAVYVGIDTSGPHGGYMGNTTPFRWLWTSIGSSIYLKKGDHYFHVFIHEDGVRIDQFMLVPQDGGQRERGRRGRWGRSGDTYGGQAYRANTLTGIGTQWRKDDGPPAHVSFDLTRQAISPTYPPDCRVVLRKLRDATGVATLRVTLSHAGADDGDWRVVEHAVDLAKMPELSMIPLDFDDLDLARLPRREFMLTAELIMDDKTLTSNRVTLLRPWEWEACGMFDYMRNHERGPLDAKMEPKPGDARQWKPVEEKSLDHFGVLDFGLHFANNSLNAPNNRTCYARTRIRVPKSGTYLFLIQTDDQMLLWLDGKQIYRYDDDNYMPVTRSARRYKVPLETGDHELRMRVNQTHTRWQASVRIRTEDDLLSDVVGIPLEESPSIAENAETAERSSAKR